MSLNIPDSLPKLLVFLGLLLLTLSFYLKREWDNEYNVKFDQFDQIQDKVNFESYLFELDENDLMEKSNVLSEKLEVENLIKLEDSIVTFTRFYSGDKRKITLTDSLEKYWKRFNENKKELDILIKNREIKLNNFNQEERIWFSRIEYYSNVFSLGLALLIVGIGAWMIEDLKKSEDAVVQKNKIYDFCQSCGFKFSSVRIYGREKNKTENFAFCRECYDKGKFKDPKLSKEEFLKRKNKEIKNLGFRSKMILKKRFDNLERWNKNSYF